MSRSNTFGRRVAFGSVLIVFGLSALLDGAIDGFPHFWQLVPLYVIVFLAVSKIGGGRRRHSWTTWLALAGLAIWQLAILTDLSLDINLGRFFWPLAIVAAGFYLVVRSLSARSAGGANSLTAVFGSSERAFAGPLPGQLSATALFGSCQIDLSKATVNGPAAVEVFVMFGSVELRIPEGWATEQQVSAVFGGVSGGNSVAGALPDLVVSGSVLLGSLEIKN